AKTKHNNILDTIDEIITNGKKKGVLHLYTEDEKFSGRKIQINGKELYHFGTTGYMGLEQDERLKEAAIDAIRKFGTQFPLSKTYLSFGIYKDLEEALTEMYGTPVLVAKNSTLSHIGVIPSVVRDEDAVILDHQVHWSVQNACQLLKPRGISVDLLRHNSLDMLEEKIKNLGQKYEKVWYMIDGVYSMYGDFAPLDEIIQLMDKYPQLYLYVDDVHGMSWAGKNGTGWVMSQIKTTHPKILLTGTLSKSFGASGSILVCPNEEIHRKIKTFGGPLTFSAQLEPPSVAAALASAKIHLSDEIYQYQKELRESIDYCNKLISETELPLVVSNYSPVFFIGTGLPAVGYNFVERLMKEGFYVNLGVFPAVPVRNTGVRFTISRHNRKEDIYSLVEAMKYHYPKALEEEGKTYDQVRKAFGMLPKEAKNINVNNLSTKLEDGLSLVHFKTIEQINKEEWNQVFGNSGNYNWDGLKFMESVFKNNEKEEDNWEFNYFIVKDKKGSITAATFFTTTLWKEDMLSQPYISEQIEIKRKEDPYYLTSRVLSMGSLISTGSHLFLQRNSDDWKKSISLILDAVAKLDESTQSSMIVLRDFEKEDSELKEFLIEQGYFTIDMPNDNVIDIPKSWGNEDQFLEILSARNRRHLRNDVLKFQHYYDIEYVDKVPVELWDHLYQLYLNVKERNLGVNTFPLPKRIIEAISKDENWETVLFYIKDEYDERKSEKLPVAVVWSFKSCNTYCPVFIGVDYNYNSQLNVYRQCLYQVVNRANNLGAKKIYLGLTADVEKKKVGARQIPMTAFIQAKDNYNLELLGMINVKKS
ncbi:MAG TPA: aminotransferase class I/II-fold pyridoxal phosphate-dependent enzyme, partial [Cytophagaceae bacterium]